MPKLLKNEKRNHYVNRCMIDPEVKKKKPDTQARLGYCEGLYTSKKKKNRSKGSKEEPNFDKDTNVGGLARILPDL